MRNSTKLKTILQLYTITLDMDDDETIHLTAINKRSDASETFINKTYSRVIGKVFSHMLKEMKLDLNHSNLPKNQGNIKNQRKW